jgi:hypothetical protein
MNYRGFYLKTFLYCFFVNYVQYVTDGLSSSPTFVSTTYHKILNIYLPSSLHPHPPTAHKIKASNVSNVTHSLILGAEPFVRSCQLCSYSRTSQHFMEPASSLLCSQEPFTGPYSEPVQSNPYHPILSL